jgi:hypothetical protein
MPVLLFKAGEQTALRYLAEDIRAKVFPLLEFVPPEEKMGLDGEVIQPPPMDQYLRTCAKKLLSCWGTSVHVAIDPLYLDPYLGPDLDSISVLEYLFHQLRSLGVRAIPVVSPNTDPKLILAARKICAEDGYGVCFRIGTWRWPDLEIEADFGSTINRLADSLNLPAESIDLVFDARNVDDKSAAGEIKSMKLFLKHLPRPETWRSLAFTSCAFPKTLSNLDENKMHTIKRSDWMLWREMNAEGGVMGRVLYGDYGINYPSQSVITAGGFAHSSAQARYTTEVEWLCPKGTLINDVIIMGELKRSGAGLIQFRHLAEQLVKHPKFKFKKFSYGDKQIIDIAAGHQNPGNPGIWRGIGANHHITLVVRQLLADAAS